MLTVEEIKRDIAIYQDRIQNPAGLTPQQLRIYTLALAEARQALSELEAFQHGPVTPISTPPPTQPIKHTAPPPSPEKPWPPVSETMEEAAEQELQRAADNPNPKPATHTPPTGGQGGASRHIYAGNQHPVNSKQPMSATIQADHSTNPHNPTITITWADGYTYTGDETAIRGRFTTTLRDTLTLRLVQQGRYSAMWRWSSPWRAAGFYQALTHLIGTPPTLQDLGFHRPNDLTRTVFTLITEKALQPQP